jgi:hypothetical protein
MRWSDIRWTPTRGELRLFAGLWLGLFLVLAAWQGGGQGRTGLAIAFAALALSVGLIGLARPQAVRPVYVTWWALAFPVGWAVSHLLLAALFYGLFTPVAWAFRLAGRDALALRRPGGRETYWTVKPQVTDARRYFRQF